MELTDLSLAAASAAIRQGEISPLALTQACLERSAALNPAINCWIRLDEAAALQQAEQAARIKPATALHGIPVGLKDLFETRGLATTAGSSFFRDYIPTQDAEVVARLRAAGAVLPGKLNMHEIALGVTNANPHFGACRNPWNLERISGGSSGGSAAALAARLCPAALGTDTGGSIRIPAALCGVVGLKPTRGRLSLRGVIPLSWNLDHAGPMARQVEDVALLYQALAGYDPQDPYSVDAPVEDPLPNLRAGVVGWKIALAWDDYFEESDPQVLALVQDAAEVFARLGAQVSRTPFPGARAAALANGLMTTSDAAAFHAERLRTHPEGFGADVLARLQSGAAFSSGEYSQARRTQALLRRQFSAFLGEYDLLLTPTTPVSAPPIEGPDAVEQARLLTRYTAPFNLTGLPALSLPCGFTADGLPAGLQLVARPWGEAGLLRAAWAYEQAAGWHLHRPNL